MAYNKFQSAFTHCQSLRMVETAHNFPSKCQYVEAVGGACAPPSAFITQTARDLANTNQYCTETLVLSASFNEVEYKCDIMLQGSQFVVFTTGWTNGAAQNIKFTTDPSWNQTFGTNLLVLSPNTNYVATLTVENSCNDQDHYTYNFTTPVINNCTTEEPDPWPGGGGAFLMVVNPNPASESISFTFDGLADEVFSIKAVNLLTSSITTFTNNYSATAGSKSMTLNVSQLIMGQYNLMAESKGKSFQGQFIKL